MGNLLSKRLATERLAASVRFSEILKEYEPTDGDEVFERIVSDAIRFHGLAPADLAGEFNVAQATISRWASGKSRPPIYARRNMVERIAKLIRYRCERLTGRPTGGLQGISGVEVEFEDLRSHSL